MKTPKTAAGRSRNTSPRGGDEPGIVSGPPTFAAVFEQMLDEHWAADDASLARAIGHTQGAITRARDSNPTFVTTVIQKICDKFCIDADQLVFKRKIVTLVKPPAEQPAEPAAEPPAAAFDLAEAGPYLAILHTETGKAIRVLVRDAYERLRTEGRNGGSHSGKP